MKWSEFKKMTDDILDKEPEENKDPEISCIDISDGSLSMNPEIIIHVDNGELEIF